MELFYDILDERRQALVPLFVALKDEFYLAGGTGLALQIGHRDSIDFDFFIKRPIDTAILEHQLQDIFSGHLVVKVQEERDTLGIIVDERVKMSFMTYPYELVDTFVSDAHFSIASIRDIGCMKCSAITHRSTTKDYIDLYFILKRISIAQLIEDIQKKFPTLDINLVLKSMVYFDDIVDEPIMFKRDQTVSFDTVKSFLRKEVERYSAV